MSAIRTSQLTDRTLDVLEAVARLGSTSLPEVQAHCGLSMATAHRILQSLIERGFVMRTGRADYRLGSAAITLADGVSLRDILAPAARPHLLKLAKQTKSHAHLGVWKDAMVAYQVKQRFGKVPVHSAEGAQLEGYCSALGKILLSALPDDELERYLDDGAFVALTPHTITDPEQLRAEIAVVRSRSWAADNEEIALGLRCVAVPVRGQNGQILAAISVSRVGPSPRAEATALLPLLRDAAEDIAATLFPVRIQLPVL
ncbi:IclR family transcriptional regulator [Sphingobium sp. AP50]|uniref:IclR family transcriptional regulator n=1 Tax=Sphingobium sp. AP50 TaxID=1884369 RepID=UPI0015A5379C|nr:IclR family transcriptional regulator [Sphingobium sp. AP50]